MRLRYWIRTGMQTLLITLGAAVFYGLLIWLQGQSIHPEDVFSMLTIYLLMFGTIMPMVMNMGVYKFNLSLASSFGSTRNEALVGLQLFRLLPAVLTTALVMLLNWFAGPAALFLWETALALSLGLALIGSSGGVILGVLFSRFGKLAAILSGVVFVMIGMGCGLLAGMDVLDGAAIAAPGKLVWLLPGIGLILYSLSMIPEQRTVWKYNVKL